MPFSDNNNTSVINSSLHVIVIFTFVIVNKMFWSNVQNNKIMNRQKHLYYSEEEYDFRIKYIVKKHL